MTDTPNYYQWQQGGKGVNAELPAALPYLERELDHVAYEWEVREPGEATEQDTDYLFYETLWQATRAALPYCEVWGSYFGLSRAQLAFIAQQADLVLSTGAMVDQSNVAHSGWFATDPSKRVTIYEGASAYWIYLVAAPDEEACMGDMVDALHVGLEDTPLLPGTDALHQHLEFLLRRTAYVDALLEAYFGEKA